MTMITGTEMMQQQAQQSQQLPPQSDSLDSLDQLFFVFKAPAYTCRVVTPIGEAFVGEPVEIHSCSRARNRKLELIRKPPKSQKELSDGNWRLIPDIPGLYSLRITVNDHWSRLVHLAVFPQVAQKLLGYQDERKTFERRMRLRAICRDPRVTPESIIASLESNHPTFGFDGVIVGLRKLEAGEGADGSTHGGFSIQNYG